MCCELGIQACQLIYQAPDRNPGAAILPQEHKLAGEGSFLPGEVTSDYGDSHLIW